MFSGTTHLLRARHYAVIPLAEDRAGLVQWVGGAVPLFSLYNSWLYKRNSPIGEVRR